MEAAVYRLGQPLTLKTARPKASCTQPPLQRTTRRRSPQREWWHIYAQC